MSLPPALNTFKSSPRPLLLRPGVQHYAWGDPVFLPALLGEDGGGKPHAELWMGAHPACPSQALLEGAEVPLEDLIRAAPEVFLGAETARRFGGRLPFLFKILAAAKPLSIQAHPGKRQAEEGFARENARGLALSSPERNYKDDNHKPELLVAVTEFHGLRGFRPFAELARLAEEAPELAPLLKDFHPTPGGLRALYETMMSPAALPPRESDALLNALLTRLAGEDARRPFAKTERGHWIRLADRLFPTDKSGHKDRGLYAFLLLNLVRLAPGEGIYLEPGVLHSYLDGVGMEVMANSDNALRGGLTPKHVDVPELLKTLAFSGAAPEVRRGRHVSEAETLYREAGDGPEFSLSRLDLAAGRAHPLPENRGARIFFVLSAPAGVAVSSAGGSLDVRPGRSFFLPAGVACALSSPAPAVLYGATVPTEV